MKRNVLMGSILLSSVLYGTCLSGEWNVMDAGASPDGTGDNTAIFQKLLDQAGKAGGGIVKVPAGQYCIKGNLSIPAAVTLEGVFQVPPCARHDRAATFHGSVLLAYAGRGSTEGPPFIRLNGNMATLSGFIVHYPQWKQSDVPPVPYPPCVLGKGYHNLGVLNCCFINPYEAVRFEKSARHLVRNVYGYPSWRGLFVDECYDIGRVENCHFWPFGVSYNQDEPFCKWVNVNGVAFEFARTDWQYVLNTFCFGYGVGYKFSAYAAGGCNGNFLGIGADSCRRAVLVKQGQPPGLLITNGEFVGRWGSKDSVCIEIEPEASTKVSLANCSFWGPIDRCVWLRSEATQFTANGCNFLHWDINGRGEPAIQLDTGKAIIQGNTFGNGDVNVLVNAEVSSAILMGNQGPEGFKVVNHAGDHTIILANEQDPVQWTAQSREAYQIDVGVNGDGRYLRKFHHPDKQSNREVPWNSCRWSNPGSLLLLPVNPNQSYTLKLQLEVPQAAISDGAGLYCEDKLLAELKSGQNELTAKVPPTSSDRVTIEMRCQGWQPSKVMPPSKDTRTLGIHLFAVSMQTGKSSSLFDANTGKWLKQISTDK